MKLGRVKQPPGGWHFPVAEGVELRAGTEELLVKQIHEYRVRNNIPPGDIERDIDNYYCTQYAGICYKETTDYVLPAGIAADPPREPAINRVTRWVTTLISRTPRGGFPLVSTSDANKRGMICSSCPANVVWKTGCPGCSSNITTLLLQVRQLRTTPHDPALFACLVGGWGNDAAIHLNASELALTEEQKAKLPDRCWRKTL